MNAAVLIIYMGMGYGQYDIKFQEFATIRLCKEAITQISSLSENINIQKMICVDK